MDVSASTIARSGTPAAILSSDRFKNAADILVIILYFVVVLAVGLWLYRLCWSLRNSKEERIDLDADEEKDFSDSSEEKLEIEHEGLFWKAFDIFYGLDQQKETKMSKEEEAHYKIRITDTSEDPIWGTIVNVNGIILLSVAIVVHVYFA